MGPIVIVIVILMKDLLKWCTQFLYHEFLFIHTLTLEYKYAP